jgi:hypothetical protein
MTTDFIEELLERSLEELYHTESSWSTRSTSLPNRRRTRETATLTSAVCSVTTSCRFRGNERFWSDNSQTARDHDTDVSSRVVREVADAPDTDPLHLDPLYESIDPEALNDLFRKPAEPFHERRVEFTIQGCDVAV